MYMDVRMDVRADVHRHDPTDLIWSKIGSCQYMIILKIRQARSETIAACLRNVHYVP